MAIDTILLALGDNDEQRVDELTRVALEMARPTDATIVIGHVFESDREPGVLDGISALSGTAPYLLTEQEYDQVLDEGELEEIDDESANDIAAKHETVQNAVQLLSDEAPSYAIRGVVGKPGDALVALSKEINADQIVVGGRQRSPTDKAVFGSVAQNVMLSAPCPVTFVHGEEENDTPG
ncbi:universal stress protein [Haloarcula sp. JP-L23]|uniref:universal stress protein n=1 Tax=Haloarcula sp. JP-L23 TaxID=2716717 RepID=UPI00140EB497|nr:universal stress protein [Haloarcula sp. JP-L23]